MGRRARRRDRARGTRARLAREGTSVLDRVPTAAWVVAGVVGLLVAVAAVSTSERRARHAAEDRTRTLLVESERARERADYGSRLRNEPGFERAEAARVGAAEDEAERRRAAEGLTPRDPMDRW